MSRNGSDVYLSYSAGKNGQPVVVVVVVVRSDRVFRKLYRERELQFKIATVKKSWRKL